MLRQFLDLTDDDIRNNPHTYDEEQLLYTLKTYNVSLRILNRYQTLTPYICAKYVIFGGNCEKYGDCSEDRWLDDYNILRCQPHITREALSEAHLLVSLEEENEVFELQLMCDQDFDATSM